MAQLSTIATSSRPSRSISPDWYAAWCGGREDDELAAAIEAKEALLHNFCISGVLLRRVTSDSILLEPKAAARLTGELRLLHDTHTAAVRRMIKGGRREIPGQAVRLCETDERYARLVREAHSETSSLRRSRRWKRPRRVFRRRWPGGGR